MTVQGTTAEWTCTRCATVNRKLVAGGTVETRDRCVHCRAKHEVRAGTPPTWEATLRS